MQRTHSLTSVSSAASSTRHKAADPQRQDLTTESLLSESSIFHKKPRKPENFSGRSQPFSFPNGEVFTPRAAPTKRHRPPRMHPANGNTQNYPPSIHQTNPSNLPRIPRSASMVSVPTAALNAALGGGYSQNSGQSYGRNTGHTFGENPGTNMTQNQHPSAGGAHQYGAPLGHAGSYMSRSHSFNNLRIKSKQELVNSLRNSKIDIPTNIHVQAPPSALPVNPTNHYAPAQGRSLSLTNNRYADNAANIVRSESMVSSTIPGHLQGYAPIHGPGHAPSHIHSQGLGASHQGPTMGQVDRPPSSDSTPSIISTYNLNRSNSNTPQTSVSGSDTTPENAPPVWDSAESVSSFRTARDPSPLPSIEESIGTSASPEPVESANSQHCGVSPLPSPSVSENLESEPSDSSHGTGTISQGEFSKTYRPDHSNTTLIPEKSTPILKTGNGLSGGNGPAGTSTSNVPTREDVSSAISTISSDATLGGTLAQSSINAKDNVSGPLSDSDALDHATKHPQEIEDRRSTEESVGRTSQVSLDKPLVGDIAKQTLESDTESQISVSSEKKSVMSTDDNVDPSLKNAEATSAQSKKLITETCIPKEITDTNSIQASVAIQNTSVDGGEKANTENDVNSKSNNDSTSAPDDRIKVLPSLSLSERRRPGISPISTSSTSFDSRDLQPAVRTPKGNESTRITRSESDLRSLIDSLKGEDDIPMRRDLIPEEIDVQSPSETIMQSLNRAGCQNPQIPRSYSQDNLSIDDSGLYTPDHIDRFLTDDQEAVPPRGDVAVKDGAINFHKRNPSSIGSINSPQLKGSVTSFSPREPHSPYGNSLRGSRSMETLNSHAKTDVTPGQKRSSMLAIVDVDYDTPLPYTPKRDFFSTSPLDETKPELEIDPVKEKLPEKNTSIPRNASIKTTSSKDPSAKGLKKIFKFLKFGSKSSKEPPTTLRWKSSRSSLGRSASSTDLSKEIPNERLNNRSSLSFRSSSTHDRTTAEAPIVKPAGNKKKEFLSNLKLTTGFKVYDLPSPTYSVRERTDLPDRRSFIEDSDKLRVDLPHYDVEDDSFGDVLLKFKEVEEEIEREVRVVRKSKSIHDFFLRDDELSKAQISDLQKKDHNLSSSESLPGKSNNADENSTSFDSTDGDIDPFSQEMLSEQVGENIVDFPQNSDSCTVVMNMEHVSAALSSTDPKKTRKSYLKFVRQLNDFKEVKIELRGFDPTQKTEVAARPQRNASIINRKATKEPKSVKFSNCISISETYDPGWYKRNNRSVTQYYLTEYSEINRIKNELNAYKCYEMLVHEKSQTNTHFFY